MISRDAGLCESYRLGGLLRGVLGGGAVRKPIAKPAIAPFLKVLLGDGTVFKGGFEKILNFWEAIEPGGKFWAGLAVVEAVIEFFAERCGEAGDLTDTRGRYVHGYTFGL